MYIIQIKYKTCIVRSEKGTFWGQTLPINKDKLILIKSGGGGARGNGAVRGSEVNSEKLTVIRSVLLQPHAERTELGFLKAAFWCLLSHTIIKKFTKQNLSWFRAGKQTPT